VAEVLPLSDGEVRPASCLTVGEHSHFFFRTQNFFLCDWRVLNKNRHAQSLDNQDCPFFHTRSPPVARPKHGASSMGARLVHCCFHHAGGGHLLQHAGKLSTLAF
jgi:hypothetical protein